MEPCTAELLGVERLEEIKEDRNGSSSEVRLSGRKFQLEILDKVMMTIANYSPAILMITTANYSPAILMITTANYSPAILMITTAN